MGRQQDPAGVLMPKQSEGLFTKKRTSGRRGSAGGLSGEMVEGGSAHRACCWILRLTGCDESMGRQQDPAGVLMLKQHEGLFAKKLTSGQAWVCGRSAGMLMEDQPIGPAAGSSG